MTKALRPKSASEHPVVREALAELGARVRAARIARDLTQDELAARTGVQAGTLGRLEKGAPGVSVETLALVLWQLNLLDHLEGVAAAANDPEGQRLAALRAPRRARGRQALPSTGWDVLDRL